MKTSIRYILTGSALLLGAVVRRRVTGAVLAVAGSALVYRGIRQRKFEEEVPEDPEMPKYLDNPVDEASWESFPASDPPAWIHGGE